MNFAVVDHTEFRQQQRWLARVRSL